MSILIAGLSPADQKVLFFDRFRLDQVNRVADRHGFLSGKAVNVAVGIAALGGSAELVVPLGGERSRHHLAELEESRVSVHAVHSETATRVCTTLIDREQGTVTEIVEPSMAMHERELDTFRSIFQEQSPQADLIVLSGSLPQNCPNDFYHRLLEKTEAKRVIADLQGEPLLQILPDKPFLVKPNREELATSLKRDLSSDHDLLEGMRRINDLGAVWVLVTDGEREILLSSENKRYRFIPVSLPHDQVVNPIGCGDSMTAAIAWSLERGESIVQAVQFGIGAGAMNACHLLPARLEESVCRGYAESVPVREFN